MRAVASRAEIEAQTSCPWGTTGRMWTLLFGTVALASAPTPWRCGTVRAEVVGLFDPGAARLHLTAVEEPPDPWGTWPHELGSEHFLVRWGDDGAPVTPGDAQAVLDTLERARALFVDELLHTEPVPGDGGRFRVYLGDSWTEGPPGYGNAGYFWSDPNGQPILVLADWVVRDEDGLNATATHELYHAVQSATGSYAYEGISAWYWEATATWIPTLLYPVGDYQLSFLHAYAFNPHLPVDHFRYAESGALEELYQYGAFVFPLHLAEWFGAALIRDSWELPDPNGDPLTALHTHLTAKGFSLPEQWLAHGARNVTWDYPDSARYHEFVDAWSAALGPEVDHQLVGEVPAGGALDLRPPRSLRPGRFGLNVWGLTGDGAELQVQVTGDARGSLDSPARWGARLVRNNGAAVWPVPFDGTVGRLYVPPLAAGERAWLVFGAWSDDRPADPSAFEQFDYRLDVVPVPSTLRFPTSFGDPGEPSRACGCTQARPPAGALLALLPPLTRRRPRRPAPTER